MKFLNYQEIAELPMGRVLVFDIEIYRNFFFVAFKDIESGNYIVFDADENKAFDWQAVAWFISRHTLVGFNSANFDMPLLAYAITGASVKQVKQVCDRIINDNLRKYDFYRTFQLDPLPTNHIDLIEVCPLDGSLEIYAARLGAKSIEPMPVKPQMFLSHEDKGKVGMYCLKDLDCTELIYRNLEEQLDLRADMSKQYEIDLMSASDAQIAEKVVKAELTKVMGKLSKPIIAAGYAFEYEAPTWVQFQNPELQELLSDIEDADFEVGDSGHAEEPEALKNRKVTIGSVTYAVGVGGLHSTESCQTVRRREGGHLVDVDVASYYPAIILNNRFAPEHLGEHFLTVYQDLVTRRLTAKREGHKADANSLKIVVNGLFGKLGSKWSCVYSPKLVLQVTITGQLALLMLIEYCESMGHKVVSANTDGVVFDIGCDAQLEHLRQCINVWETHTNFQTEETFYEGLFSRDVNNYLALKKDGSVKTKGNAFLLPEGIFRFHKNPDTNICTKAVIAYIKDGTPVRETIEACKDIQEFLIVRKITGGGEFTGEYVGKTARWYWSRYSKDAITKEVTRNGKTSITKVARSEGARPLPVLPSVFPEDVDIERYIEEAQEALYAIGAVKRFDRQTRIFKEAELALLA